MGRPGRLLAVVVLLQPVAGWAQNRAPGMPSEAEMAQMIEAMQGMQACMAVVDQTAFQRLQRQAEQAEAQMRQLCRVGQERSAQARALALGRQMAADPALKTVQACMARLPRLPMLQAASPLGQLTVANEPLEGSARPICERLSN